MAKGTKVKFENGEYDDDRFVNGGVRCHVMLVINKYI